MLIAASDSARWALNLLDQPRVDVEIGDRAFTAMAEALDAADHAKVIRGLILRYGTPAERLGRGPSFRLRPIDTGGA